MRKETLKKTQRLRGKKITQINSNALLKIQKNIMAAQNSNIIIIAVTKTRPLSSIESAIKNQIYNIGENKVQETERKLKNFKAPKKMKTHLIGHLQKNKVRKAIKLYDYIQTVDTLSLAKRINKIAEEENKTQKIFLQINIGNINNRVGFLTKEIESASRVIKEHKNISIVGVMIIPPPIEDKKKYYNYFKRAKEIQVKIKNQIKTCNYVSMGMTGDYKAAIKAGATHIRIGTALFGER